MNLPKNEGIRFQIGLILALLIVYAVFNLSFEVGPVPTPSVTEMDDEITEYQLGDFKVEEQPKAKEAPSPEKKVVIPTAFIQKEELTTSKETVLSVPEEDTPLAVEAVTVVEKEDEPVFVNSVEFAPVFPGCESVVDNKERIACMNKEMDRYIQRYFDTGLAGKYGLEGLQRISVKFTIDKAGRVTDIMIRAPHPALEKEAREVISRFPVMQPGKQGIKPVQVIFVKPILFRVE